MYRFPPVFLVERLDASLELIEESDVTLHLAVALEHVRTWLPRTRIRAQSSLDAEGVLEGVAFFDAQGALVARITVYWLEREDLSEVDARTLAVACAPVTQLDQALARLF